MQKSSKYQNKDSEKYFTAMDSRLGTYAEWIVSMCITVRKGP